MYYLNKKTRIAIVADSNKKKWPLGDYIHILSFIPNLNFKKVNWYSTNEKR